MIKQLTRPTAVGIFAAAGLYLLLLAGPAKVTDSRAEPHPAPETEQVDASASQPKQSTPDRIGITAIERELGITAPTGRTIRFAHVEGAPGNYMPNERHALFDGVQFVAVTGQREFNGHPQATATVLYGKQSLAPGVTDVHFYAANLWMMNAYLKAISPYPPMVNDRQVFTHSWIGGETPMAADVLRRADYQIDTHDVHMVVGVNNGKQSAVPVLMASAYNVIAVGQGGGQSSGGYTVFEGDGRCKPDIAGSGSKTSFTTPAVAAIVARLLEAAQTHTDEVDEGGNKLAARAEVIKAVLMAGAEKLPGWKQVDDHPLDEHLGAGYARFDHSFHILAAGAVQPGRVRQARAWAFEQLDADQQHAYTFDLTEPMGEASIMLVWNRRILGEQRPIANTEHVRWATDPRLADFNLRLVHIDALGKQREFALSASKVDNVEHIYLPDLPEGRYRIEVERADELDETWDYALAWRIEPPAEPEATTPAD